AAAQQQAGPSLEDLFRCGASGDAQLAPDGAMALYTLRSGDLEENEANTEIWLAHSAGGEPLRTTTNPKNNARPRWSPDGSRFAFTSVRGTGEEARSALYVMSPRGGEPELLYRHATGINAFEWAPDGRTIAFTATEEESKEQKEAKENGRDVEI